MRKTVFEDYPVANLPDDLRAKFADQITVRITIEASAADGPAVPLYLAAAVPKKDETPDRFRELHDNLEDS